MHQAMERWVDNQSTCTYHKACFGTVSIAWWWLPQQHITKSWSRNPSNFYLVDWDCRRMDCSSVWASSKVMFIGDSCVCFSSDLMLNTQGVFSMIFSRRAGNDRLGLSLLAGGFSYSMAWYNNTQPFGTSPNRVVKYCVGGLDGSVLAKAVVV